MYNKLFKIFVLITPLSMPMLAMEINANLLWERHKLGYEEAHVHFAALKEKCNKWENLNFNEIDQEELYWHLSVVAEMFEEFMKYVTPKNPTWMNKMDNFIIMKFINMVMRDEIGILARLARDFGINHDYSVEIHQNIPIWINAIMHELKKNLGWIDYEWGNGDGTIVPKIPS